jgi:hypothetical protein
MSEIFRQPFNCRRTVARKAPVRTGCEKEDLDRHPQGEEEEMSDHDAAPSLRDLRHDRPEEGRDEQARSRQPDQKSARRRSGLLIEEVLDRWLRASCHGLPLEIVAAS